MTTHSQIAQSRNGSDGSSTVLNNRTSLPNLSRTCMVRGHTRSLRLAYDPAVHAEIRVNLDIERALEEDLAHFVEGLR